MTHDGSANSRDLIIFAGYFRLADPTAVFNRAGTRGNHDLIAFANAFLGGFRTMIRASRRRAIGANAVAARTSAPRVLVAIRSVPIASPRWRARREAQPGPDCRILDLHGWSATLPSQGGRRRTVGPGRRTQPTPQQLGPCGFLARCSRETADGLAKPPLPPGFSGYWNSLRSRRLPCSQGLIDVPR